MRAFNPPSLGLSRPDFYADLIEKRLAHNGEYVRHLPANATPQWVVMNYQYIPISASVGGDYLVNGTNPRLWGYIDHFADKPEIYREGDSARPSRGSQFEVRGLLFNVKRIDVNHAGYVSIELVQADNCGEVRAEFFDAANDLLCLKIPDCA